MEDGHQIQHTNLIWLVSYDRLEWYHRILELDRVQSQDLQNKANDGEGGWSRLFGRMLSVSSDSVCTYACRQRASRNERTTERSVDRSITPSFHFARHVSTRMRLEGDHSTMWSEVVQDDWRGKWDMG
ncbi:hypothetical protein FRC20_001386 [Serendipita sp. 405]|nr:hypothetical protein FRC20_001386 [Serendipita sp. 405]